jgi:hypothetical protein
VRDGLPHPTLARHRGRDRRERGDAGGVPLEAHAHPLVRANAFALPFGDGSFQRVFTGHFYGHLLPEQRARFLGESRRLAPELVVVDAKIHPAVATEQTQQRVLNDGSSHHVFKRYFTATQLTEELGGGQVVFDGRWFVMVAASREPRASRRSP